MRQIYNIAFLSQLNSRNRSKSNGGQIYFALHIRWKKPREDNLNLAWANLQAMESLSDLSLATYPMFVFFLVIPLFYDTVVWTVQYCLRF